MKMANGDTDAKATPAQLCSMLSTLITGGSRYRGHLLYEVRNFTTGEIVSKPQPEVLSSFSLNETNRHLIMRALSQNAQNDASFASLHEKMAQRGVSIGCLKAVTPSGSANPNHAIALAFGDQTVALTGQNNPSVCVCVVLENGLYTGRASAVAAKILEHFYH